MNYEQVAALCHEVNRAYCASLGDDSQQSWADAPDWQKESSVNGVKFLMENNATPEETHISWMREKEAAGWVYGEVKDPDKKTHPCMVLYNELPQEQRSKDHLFKAICEFFKESIQHDTKPLYTIDVRLTDAEPFKKLIQLVSKILIDGRLPKEMVEYIAAELESLLSQDK